MYKLANGWTKETVMAQIKKYNRNERAVRNNTTGDPMACGYETQDGNRCAIGCFIPDGHVALGCICPVSELLDDYPELEKFMPLTREDGALTVFQRAHDDPDQGVSVYQAIENFLAQVEE